MSKNEPQAEVTSSDMIDARIKGLGDWRGEMLSRIRALIKQADPAVVEEWKWRGVPVWSHDGLICTGETYKSVVKTTFAKGAALEDPSGLFNASLEGNTRRAIDFHEGETIDEEAFKGLVRAALTLNASGARGTATRSRSKSSASGPLTNKVAPQGRRPKGDHNGPQDHRPSVPLANDIPADPPIQNYRSIIAITANR